MEEKPDVTYSDVGGCKEQIEKLREVVETPLLHVSADCLLCVKLSRAAVQWAPALLLVYYIAFEWFVFLCGNLWWGGVWKDGSISEESKQELSGQVYLKGRAAT